MKQSLKFSIILFTLMASCTSQTPPLINNKGINLNPDTKVTWKGVKRKDIYSESKKLGDFNIKEFDDDCKSGLSSRQPCIDPDCQSCTEIYDVYWYNDYKCHYETHVECRCVKVCPDPVLNEKKVYVSTTVSIDDNQKSIYSPANQDGVFDNIEIGIMNNDSSVATLSIENEQGNEIVGGIVINGNRTLYWNGRFGIENFNLDSPLENANEQMDFVPEGKYIVKLDGKTLDDGNGRLPEILIDNTGPEILVNYNSSVVNNLGVSLNVKIDDPIVNGVNSKINEETLPDMITSIDGTQITLNLNQENTSTELQANLPNGFQIASLSEDDKVSIDQAAASLVIALETGQGSIENRPLSDLVGNTNICLRRD